MTEIWTQAALWLGLALLASLLSIWLRVATALSEIVVGTIAQLLIGAALGGALLAGDASWIKFLAGAGAILLTFLAGAELDPAVFKKEWKQATAIGLVSFAGPFLGCFAIARWGLDWSPEASWLAGIAMSTTSVAVVYAVMLEFGLNVTHYGKVVLAACFITDLATVVALGLIFAPFTWKTLVFLGAGAAAFFVLPWIVPRFFKRYGGRPSELEAKFLMFALFGMGALATWADSEAVLPAYLLGMVLAGTVGKDHALIRRLRTLTFGLLTPFYFIRAGSLVSLPALVAAPMAFVVLLGGKMLTKVLGVYPVTRLYKSPKQEGMYTTLLMSTGLTFGILGVSQAVARAAAEYCGLPLYAYLGGVGARHLPIQMMNVLNGGKHADSSLDFQEFMIFPQGAPTFAEALRYGSETFQALKKILHGKGYATSVGDEGGFAPQLKGGNEEACELIVAAIEKAGYQPGKDIAICLDPAASSFFEGGKYRLTRSGQGEKTPADMVALFEKWVRDYPIVSIEDGHAENDWDGFKAMTAALGDKIQIVGDDLVVTNPKFIAKAIGEKACNAALIKLNQIGTVSETIDAIHLCRKAGWGFVISHRSGETEDAFMADFAVAMGGGQIKTGSVCRSERIAKYNRLLEIEAELGAAARFGG